MHTFALTGDGTPPTEPIQVDQVFFLAGPTGQHQSRLVLTAICHDGHNPANANTSFAKGFPSPGDYDQSTTLERIRRQPLCIDYLDAFCGINLAIENCSKLFNSIIKNTKILYELSEKKQNAEHRQELLSFQLNEISAINPLPDEDIELEEELQTLKHLDELVETANRLSLELTDDDESIYNRISSSLIALEKLVNIDQKLGEYSELIRSASLSVQETSAGLSNYVNSLNHDKNRLIEIQDRLGAIDGLKRKYGGSIDAILITKNLITEDLNNFSSLDKYKSLIFVLRMFFSCSLRGSEIDPG